MFALLRWYLLPQTVPAKWSWQVTVPLCSLGALLALVLSPATTGAQALVAAVLPIVAAPSK
jgi:hypothetical protein